MLSQSAFSLILSLMFALLTPSGVRAEQPLMPYAQLPKSLQSRVSAAALASFHYRLDAGVDCTGTYISSTGHFITALHCVAGCLARAKAIVKERAIDEPTAKVATGFNAMTGVLKLRSLYTNTMTVSEDRVDQGILCPGALGSASATQQRADMKIILTGGKGWLAPKETLAGFSKKFPEEYKALLDNGYEHGADFAILQVENATATACLPLAKAAPPENRELHAIPFACVTREPNLSADGHQALYTSGRRTAGFKQSDYFRALGNSKMPFDAKSVERVETFFSTLDMEKCGSGTGIFDETLSLVGIATRVYKSSTRYERGSLEAIDVAQVWRELMDKKSGSDIKEITSCHTRQPASVTVSAPTPAGPTAQAPARLTVPKKVQFALKKKRQTKPPAEAQNRLRRQNPARS